ncbi:Protein involved in propanediol utilization [Evansella caseinilytica]|uniref:Protein involved in propanediol utilization n=1 Tax=Evansella caseinilytica TaxID=1503961 RepID=A0A1H3LBX8_9BACI|nr:kinase [Evansella caseinilytica]SDY61428.1 Protein involved in propanediol utilization [Evansella caseinilytica]
MNSIIKANNNIICETNGTFGEVLQGFLPNRKHFLVTLPINIKSQAIFLSDSSVNEVKVYPAHKNKVVKALSLLKKEYKINLGGTLIIKSDIPEGKGMASSSADIVSSLNAILQYLVKNRDFNELNSVEIIENITRSIEPTDGVMYEDCVFYYHREAKIGNKLGALPEMLILAVDEGGEVDTIKHNMAADHFNQEESLKYERLLNELEFAIKNKDIFKIGEISTASAKLNQTKLEKKNLRMFLEFRKLNSVMGVVIAHSGTMIGVIVNPKLTSVSKDIQSMIFSLTSKNLKPSIYLNF